jgi:hypothetical protein
MLVAIQPAELSCTLDELRKVEEHVSGDYLVRLGVPGATAASVDNVTLHLSDTCIAHFACHGIQDRTNPLDSALKLDGGRLPVSQIVNVKLPRGMQTFQTRQCIWLGRCYLPDSVEQWLRCGESFDLIVGARSNLR